MHMDLCRVLNSSNMFFLIKFSPALVGVLHDDTLGLLVAFVVMDPGLEVVRVENHCDVCECVLV